MDSNEDYCQGEMTVIRKRQGWEESDSEKKIKIRWGNDQCERPEKHGRVTRLRLGDG